MAKPLLLKTAMLSLLLFAGLGPATLPAQQIQLSYKPAPVDNPLKGLVPYCGQMGDFPCSLEFSYFPIKDLMLGPSEYDWASVEKKLEACKSRGNQMVIRTYLEYPGQPSGLPDFLRDGGVEIFEYKHDGKLNRTPDYRNAKLIKAMEDFIAAFGKKYDRDPRVGFITMGVLGQWGEWHTYPKEKLFPEKQTQTRIQDAFAKSFKTTKVLMRYPAGPKDWSHAANHEYPFGYHDDSFAWATLDTGKEDDDWFFEAAMKSAGKKALDKWKTQPIGGEIRPEIWGCVFDDKSCAPKGQEFEKSVARMHVSWLMDSGMFKIGTSASGKSAPGKTRIENAKRQIQKMGYELHVKQATVGKTARATSLELQVENRGVAPFYYDWPVEVVTISNSGRVIDSFETDWRLSQTLPGKPSKWAANFASPADADSLKLAIRAINPMEGGKPLRFANKTQRKDGLLILESGPALEDGFEKLIERAKEKAAQPFHPPKKIPNADFDFGNPPEARGLVVSEALKISSKKPVVENEGKPR